jgi:hypothetical protein
MGSIITVKQLWTQLKLYYKYKHETIYTLVGEKNQVSKAYYPFITK